MLLTYSTRLAKVHIDMDTAAPSPQLTTEASPSQQYIYAGFWRRFLAYWVDFLILFFIGLILSSSFGNNPFAMLNATSLSDIEAIQKTSSSPLASLSGIIISLFFYIIFWVNYDGATPGKKLMAIKIIREEGGPITYPIAFIRYIGTFISAMTLIFFGLAYLWIAWDKKKQAWHDKIAGTLVVRTDKKPKTAIAILLTIFSILMFIGFMGIFIGKGIMLASKDTTSLEKRRQENRAEWLSETRTKDNDKILTDTPTSCGVTLPIPKTTDNLSEKERKWLYEEVALDPRNFYVVDKDILPVKAVQGVFLGYKGSTERLGGESFKISFPGINIYCVDNTKSLSLQEYKSLALANKTYNITLDKIGNEPNIEGKSVYWGELELYPIRIVGTTEEGQKLDEPAYIGVSSDKSKLLYMKIWGPDDNDLAKPKIDEDIDIIVRNLRYRTTTNSPNPSLQEEPINANVKGVQTTEWIKP